MREKVVPVDDVALSGHRVEHVFCHILDGDSVHILSAAAVISHLSQNFLSVCAPVVGSSRLGLEVRHFAPCVFRYPIVLAGVRHWSARNVNQPPLGR